MLPRFLTGTSCVVWGLILALCNPAMPVRAESPPGSLRRPIALALSADATVLYVANRDTGTISLVEPSSGSVVDELRVGEVLSDLQSAGDGLLLACDEAAHQLLLLDVRSRRLRVRQRLPVSAYPVCISVSSDNRDVVLASLWSRRLTFVRLPRSEGESAEVVGTLDLPFAPRCLKQVREGKQLIVGDSFGGRLAVVDLPDRRLRHIRMLPGHNIRGLEVDATGEMLLVAHQMLNELAHTVRNDVHWGLLMSNDLRWLRLGAVLSPNADLYHQAHMHPLGHAGSATGDPSGLAVTADGTVLVALGGVDEVAVGRRDDFSLHRLRVGRRPTAIAVRQDGRQAFVANTFGDSVSVIDVAARSVSQEISLGTSADLTLAEQGELLFFDARLSHDHWMSCHSCHTNGHTNGMLSDNLSDDSFGAPKRILSLLGAGSTGPFAWNASAPTLAHQIRKSIKVTMQSDSPVRAEDVSALAAYIESLRPPPSLRKARGESDRSAVARGRGIFEQRGCGECHVPPHYTSDGLYDVGLEDSLGNRNFNPPSLLGVSQRGPYFHDNRAQSLEDVFRQFAHPWNESLAEDELDDLVAFLRSL